MTIQHPKTDEQLDAELDARLTEVETRITALETKIAELENPKGGK